MDVVVMRRERWWWLVPVLVLAVLRSGTVVVQAEAAVLQPGKLEWHYYRNHNSCRYAEQYVRHQVEIYWKNDKTVTPKLLRLLYSDCMVTGCDASILLDGPYSEKKALQNSGLGAFVLIDKIKTVLEYYCPGVVSCADILNLATRDAVHLAGGPSYPVLTGRRDGMSSSVKSVDLPSPSISWESALAYFQSRGLEVLDLTSLLGAHTLGSTRCRYVTDRLYNFNNTGKPDPNMDKAFLSQMQKLCPPRKTGEPDPLVFLNPDSGSNYTFTQSYYTRLLDKKAVLEVDQQMLLNNDTIQISEEFEAGFIDFELSFAFSISRMGNINVLTGDRGEIRRNCRYTNK